MTKIHKDRLGDKKDRSGDKLGRSVDKKDRSIDKKDRVRGKNGKKANGVLDVSPASKTDDEIEDTTDEDEFAELDDDAAIEEVAAELEEIDEVDIEVEDDPDAKTVDDVVELSSKEQSARSLEIRRAIEKRMEERQLHEDLDYLDIDLDD
ncbi:MAG: hypothetical protein GKR90_04300 [Pseudomonadales bacterium]|nr:hypothetical protein [Pseudomonadales bacterium]